MKTYTGEKRGGGAGRGETVEGNLISVEKSAESAGFIQTAGVLCVCDVFSVLNHMCKKNQRQQQS